MSIRTIFHYFLVLSPISGPRIQAIQRDAGIRRGAPTPSRGAPVSTPEVRPLPWREAGRTGVGGVPPSPHQRGLRPLWTLPPDGKRRGVGGTPQPPTKEGWAVSGLSAGGEAERRGVGGIPKAPTKEGCAVSGLSRRTEALDPGRRTERAAHGPPKPKRSAAVGSCGFPRTGRPACLPSLAQAARGPGRIIS